jgi:hypothetical protein
LGKLLAFVVMAGCSPTSDTIPGTGAREAAQSYYEALLRHDWAEAYAALHPDTRTRCSEQQFAKRAGQYCQTLGFEPQAVHVRSCEEHNSEAIAHVVFTGNSAGNQKLYKEAVTLRRSEAGWGVVLPMNFGTAKVR